MLAVQQIRELYPDASVSSGIWHPNVSTHTFKLTYNPCGCGSLIMSKNRDNIDKEKFRKLLHILKENGVGAIFTFFGQSYDYLLDFYKELGFEIVATYPNYRHDKWGNYVQHCMILNLNILEDEI